MRARHTTAWPFSWQASGTERHRTGVHKKAPANMSEAGYLRQPPTLPKGGVPLRKRRRGRIAPFALPCCRAVGKKPGRPTARAPI